MIALECAALDAAEARHLRGTTRQWTATARHDAALRGSPSDFIARGSITNRVAPISLLVQHHLQYVAQTTQKIYDLASLLCMVSYFWLLSLQFWPNGLVGNMQVSTSASHMFNPG